ncbi:hypothetical protein LCGC14_1742610 [marine sediment metagenome]|uniref:Uncharacterized protein n=1 Tax=marine sediment metagenome TaxID=412755 RepID=A0A0F9JLH5_9ZZZZ
MAVEPVIETAERQALATLNGTVNRGNLLAHNGTGWVKADASDAATNLYAQWVALEGGVTGQVIRVCKTVVLRDTDAPYTANAIQYVSGTAGAITETRPAVAADVIQVVGRALDTESIFVDIKAPWELEEFIRPDTLDTSSEPGLGTSDAGWPGPSLTGTETAFFKGRFPSNIVGAVLEASIKMDSIDAQAGDIDVTVVGAYDGASNVQDTGTAITAGDWDQTDTDNIILTLDVSDTLDAAFYTPARNWAMFIDPDVLTNHALFIGLNMRYLVV